MHTDAIALADLPAHIDENNDSVWDLSLELVSSVDLMAANPDIADQCHGGYVVEVNSFELKGHTYFFIVGDDGADWGYTTAELVEHQILEFAHTPEDAQTVARRFIMDWKRNWNLI